MASYLKNFEVMASNDLGSISYNIREFNVLIKEQRYSSLLKITLDEMILLFERGRDTSMNDGKQWLDKF